MGMKKKDETKTTKILDATVDQIIKSGAATVSTTKVAKRVGIAQSNVYLYFKDKEDLLSSVYRRELERINLTGEIDQLNDEELPLTQRVEIYIHSMYDYAMQNPDSLTIMAQIKSLTDPGTNYFTDVLKVADPVADLLNAAMDAGVLKPTHVSLHMTTVFSIIQRHSQNIAHGIYTTEQVPYEAILATIWDAITVCEIQLDQSTN